jgi:hypothetical protein
MSDTNESSAPAPAPEPEPVAPVKKPSTHARNKLSDKQKMDLKKHMDKVGKNMTITERRSHRMKMLSRVSKGMSISAAHKEIK